MIHIRIEFTLQTQNGYSSIHTLKIPANQNPGNATRAQTLKT